MSVKKGIYIHIPFCNKKCYYCDFWTFQNMESEYEKYVDYIIKEIKLYDNNTEYETVYFGGGTPSLLKSEHISKILKNINYKKNAEITLELNPFNISETKIKNLKHIGVNRLSIGAQTFDDNLLEMIGRDHKEKDIINTYNIARKEGFNNISIDLIFSLPTQKIEDLKKDLTKIIKMNPEHISIYSLIWEEGTVFFKLLNENKIKETDNDLESEMFKLIIDTLKNGGYEHYEISNFSKPNYQGIHNSNYWKNMEFVGVGVNASTYLDNKRYSNYKNLYKYYSSLDNHEKPIDGSTIEIVDNTEKEKLRKILGLRLLNEGVKIEEIDKNINELIEKQLIKIDENKMYLTEKGLYLANDVFVEFL